jgi:protein SCO1/2
VADFIFTRCAAACPAMTARMAALHREAPGDVAFVSFTVDPAHDTPDVLARYARAAGAGPNWLFLTGAQPALYSLAVEGFKLGVEEVPAGRQTEGDGPFLHSSHFVLVDGQGRVRGYYDSTEAEALARLRRDLAAVRAEGG